MSSVRKGAPTGRKPAPSERQPRRPIFTPINVGVVFAIIVGLGIAIYVPMVHRAVTVEIANIKSQTEQQKQQAVIFKKKAGMLERAKRLRGVMAEKLEDEKKYFLKGQEDIIYFFNNWLLNLLNNYNLWSSDLELEVEPKIVFKISWQMMPYETLADPRVQDLMDFFEWEYIGEGTGSGEVSMAMPNFLDPLTIKLTGIPMRYEKLRDMIEDMQTNKTYRVTVHAFKNSEDDNRYYLVRTVSNYELLFSVYFMNPEGMISGDKPPGMPDDKKL